MTSSGVYKPVATNEAVLWDHVQQLIGNASAEQEWGRQLNYSTFADANVFYLTVRNQGTGGKHITALRSTDAATIFTVTDAGVTLTTLAANAITTGTLSASGQITSTVATGTAPFVIASTTKVANLNVDLLDGLDSTDFATAAHHHDATYVNVTGDTMTDALTISRSGAGNDQALFLKHNPAVGQFGLGATNAADPSLVARDNSGNQMLTINPSGATYAIDVNPEGVVLGALNAARFTGDVLITTNLGVTNINQTGTLLGTTRAAIGASAFSGAEELRVVGQTRLEGEVTITTGGANITGGIVLASSGNIDGNGGTAGQIRIGAVIVNASSLDGSEELLVNGQSRLKGGVEVTTGGVDVTGNSTFKSQVAFQDPTTFTDTVSVTGANINLSTALVNFDAGSNTPFEEPIDTAGVDHVDFDGYIEAQHDGATIYIGYWSSPPP